MVKPESVGRGGCAADDDDLGALIASDLRAAMEVRHPGIAWTLFDAILGRLETSQRCTACALYLRIDGASALYRCVAVSPGADVLRAHVIDEADYDAFRSLLAPRHGTYAASEVPLSLGPIARGSAQRVWVTRYPATSAGKDRPLLFAIAGVAPQPSGPCGSADAEIERASATELGHAFTEIFAAIVMRFAAREYEYRSHELLDNAYLLAHDVAGPFHQIDLTADSLALDVLKDDDPTQRYCKVIQRSVMRALGHLRTVLDYASLRSCQIAGRSAVDLKPIELRSLVTTLVEAVGILPPPDLGTEDELSHYELQANQDWLGAALRHLADVVGPRAGGASPPYATWRLNQPEPGAAEPPSLIIAIGSSHARGTGWTAVPSEPGAPARAMQIPRYVAEFVPFSIASMVVDAHGGSLRFDPTLEPPSAVIELPLSRRT